METFKWFLKTVLVSHLLLSCWLQEVPWLALESVWGPCSLPPSIKMRQEQDTCNRHYHSKGKNRSGAHWIVVHSNSKIKVENSASFPYFWQDFIPGPATSEMARMCMCVYLAMAQLVGSWFSGQGLNPGPPQWKAPSPNHWTAPEFLDGERPLIGANSAYWEGFLVHCIPRPLTLPSETSLIFCYLPLIIPEEKICPLNNFPNLFLPRGLFTSWTILTQSGNTYTIFSKNFLRLSLCLILSNSIFWVPQSLF